MSHGSSLSAAHIRAGLSHPVIDSDGHWLEYGPHILPAMQRVGGDAAAEGFKHFGRKIVDTVALPLEERVSARLAQEAWWVVPTRNTRDRATAMMPNLLAERLDEFGIDFAVLYPTSGLGLPQIPDAAQRRAACAAFNTVAAEYFAAHSARLTPAAVIPMYTPEEAVAELEHARALGLKTAMFGSLMRRVIPALAREAGAPVADDFPWLDVIGLDSVHDYDPVWRCCLELGFAPTFHSNGRGRAFGLRNSPSNFVYNHVGHFAAASEAVCKALFLGGVTHRFPTLKFGFLEGGVGWACQLFADLLGHWEKRRVSALGEVDPTNLDNAGLLSLAEQYADEAFLRAMAGRTPRAFPPGARPFAPADGIDDFAACGIDDASDLVRQFAGSFYFGCEADDPMNAWAFKRDNLPHGVQLNAVFGSDIGHFDVPEMADVLPEAYELVEDAHLVADDFRDFVFANPVRFLSTNNRGFFAGTRVEKEVAAFWAGEPAP